MEHRSSSIPAQHPPPKNLKLPLEQASAKTDSAHIQAMRPNINNSQDTILDLSNILLAATIKPVKVLTTGGNCFIIKKADEQ